MSTLSVHDLQGLGTFSNVVRVPAGHSLDVDGRFILPTYSNVSSLPGSGNTAGELAFVTDTGQAFIWTGLNWIPMGGGIKGYSSANAATSPDEILQYNPSATNGAYWYDFGSGATEIYTDFSAGGYLLAAKINTSTSPTGNWTYNGSYWTSTATFNRTNGVNLNTGLDVVTTAYFEYTMTTGFRMGLGNANNILAENYSGGTARTAFTGSQFSSQHNRAAFLNWFSAGTGQATSVFDTQPYCNQGGFNYTSVSNVAMRYGWTMNNENECNSNDSAIGFGCYTNGQSSSGDRNCAAGGFRWNPTVRYPTYGFIFVK